VILEGGTIHLWFLPALACALLASGVLLALGLPRLLALLAIVLFAVGLAGGAYASTPFGFHARFNLRDGPFFSLVFFVTGAALARRRLPSTPWPGLALALAGLALQMLEVRWLHARWGANLVQDYVAATWLYGLGMGMLALSDAKRCGPRRWPRWGRWCWASMPRTTCSSTYCARSTKPGTPANGARPGAWPTWRWCSPARSG
jgi:surface polysaccharide O-acyltransferase-like enzyme